jgi:hypothetical protein
LFLIWVFDLSFFFLFCSVEKKKNFRGSMRKMGSSSAVDIPAIQVNKIAFKIVGFA